MKMWDGSEARATVPTEEMKATENVIAASPEVASTSLYAFGLGISAFKRSIDDDQGKVSKQADTKLLPLYYVSPANVAKRPADTVVRSGWYVAAEPGQSFKLLVSQLRAEKSVKLTAGMGFNIVGVRLKVDGQFTAERYLKFNQTRIADVFVRGFKESKQHSDTIRKFTFHKHATTLADVLEVLAPNAGEIQLHFLKGTLGRLVPRARNAKQENVLPAMSGTEKSAIKFGYSISIPKDDEKENIAPARDYKAIKSEILPNIITIFVRERFWLERHGIIERSCAAGRSEIFGAGDVHPSTGNRGEGNPYYPPRPTIFQEASSLQLKLLAWINSKHHIREV